MGKLPLPSEGAIQEYTIRAVSRWTDDQGSFYELFTKEGPSILVGMMDGEACVHVEGYAPYGGPHAEQLLKQARELFNASVSYDPSKCDC